MKLLHGLDALLITNPTNIGYLTGFVSVAPEAREAYLLILPHHIYLVTNSLYLEQAKLLALSNCYIVTLLRTRAPLTVVECSREKPISGILQKICHREKIARLGFEENNLTVAEYQNIRKDLRGVKLFPGRSRIEKLRMIKREVEIAHIRAAARITDRCFDAIVGKLKRGVTEAQVAWEVESFIRKQGATLAFAPIVAFGSHSSQPHYQGMYSTPSFARRDLAKLKRQDIILLDFGARVDGYCSDMTRVVFIGKPREEWKRAYETVLTAQQSVLNALTKCYDDSNHRSKTFECSGKRLDTIAHNVIKEAGFPLYPHSLGHSVGLAIHESPRLSVKKDVKLKPGMVFTVEPAIYKEGRYGIRIEDLVVLKKDSIEVLSKSPKSLTIIEN